MKLTARNDQIRSEFEKYRKENKYLPDWIYTQIAERYFISPVTVEEIIWRRGYYKDK